MNFPPVLFCNHNFSTLFANNYNNQKSSNLINYQNLCKKLLKYENKDTNFQVSAVNWLKSLEIQQLIKYCSFKNQWFVDILHEMILISNSNQDLNYKFIVCNKSEQKENQDETVISDINFLYYQKECPRFTDYFDICDEGLISLSRRKTPEEKLKKNFIENIRYITLSSNSLKNIYKSNNEKLFHELNNIVTLSYDYLSNIENLVEIFNIISNKKFFKNPIELDIKMSQSGKNYYNFKLPIWLGDKFTLPELLCAYFEQSLLINYQYYLLYNEEISLLYYDEFDDLINNIYKLKEFIINSKDNIKIIQSAKPDEIKKIFNDNQNIKKFINHKKSIDDNIRNYYIGKISYSKKHTTKTIINTTLSSLEDIFLHDKLNFVLFITFIKDSIIFKTEDFIIKIVHDIINNYWKSKVSEDLLNDIGINNNDNIINKKRKKKKKKKREENINIIMKQENNINEDNKNKILENINIFSGNQTENNEIIKKENIKDNNNSKDENIINSEKEELITNLIEYFDNSKNNIENEIKNKDSDNTIIDEKKQLEDINNDKKEEAKDKINNEDNKEISLKIDLVNNEENILKNNKKKRKEKNFFLYPTFKDKQKKNKPNKKKEKISSNIIKEDIPSKNEINEFNNNQNGEEEILLKERNVLKNEIVRKNEEENKNEILFDNNDNNDKNINEENKEKYKIKNKQKNKFNIGMKLKAIFQENLNLSVPENFQPPEKTFNKIKLKSQLNLNPQDKIKEIYEKNNYSENIITQKNINFQDETNIPNYTSFNYHSTKKGRNYINDYNYINNYTSPNDYISDNILEFNQEIINNTLKINSNKGILGKAREKFIKHIYEIINVFLINEKIDFLCSFYGSTFSGLSIENSDIDIMVKLKKKTDEKDYVNKIIHILVDKLKNNNIKYITNIIPISSASVPVIKLECDLCNDDSFSNEINNLMENCKLSYNDINKLYFDITFFLVENEQKKIPSELMIDYIKNNIIIYPQIIDIVYIMKRFLFNRKLNKSYQGGISSYSLFLITLAFIKFFKSNYEMPTSSLLIEYLNYYSNFDFPNTVIQPNKDEDIFSIIENNSISNKYSVNIIDPITGLNVAKSTFKIELIQNAFREGLDIIIRNLYQYNNEYPIIKNNIKVLQKFLGN